MGIEISKLNGYFKHLAEVENINKNGNEFIDDGEEMTAFEAAAKSAVKQEFATEEEFNAAMGLNVTTNPVKATTPAVSRDANTQTTAVNKKSDDYQRAEKNFLNDLKNAVSMGLTRSNLIEGTNDGIRNVEGLRQRLGSQWDDPRYQELRTAFDDVMQLMPETYASYKDIEARHKGIVAQMQSKGINDKLHNEILKQLEQSAKTELVKVASDDINKRFNDFLQLEPNATIYDGNMTPATAMEKIKKDLQAEGKFEGAYKDAFKNYENTVIMPAAQRLVNDAVDEVDGKTGGDRAKAAKEALKGQGKLDKYTESYFNNNVFQKMVGKKSKARKMAKVSDLEDKVEARKTQSKDEVLKQLGTKSALFEDLVSSGLITIDEDGNCDLSALSYIIGLEVGADNRMNRNAAMDQAISEKLRTKGALAVKLVKEDLTDGDAKKLAKLCGYEIEGKDWKKIILNGVLGFAYGAAAGAGARATEPAKSILVQGDSVKHNLHLEINGISDNALAGMVWPEGTSVTTTEFGVVVDIAQFIKYPDRLLKLGATLSDIIGAGWMTGIAGAALGILKGMEDTGEIPVTVTQFECTDITEYTKRVQKETPKYAEVLTVLAAAFIDEDGNWDCQAYQAFLNRAAGNGGKLNKDELECAVRKMQKQQVETTKPENNQIQEQKETTVVENKDAFTSEKSEDIYADVPTIDGSRTGWEQIAKQYGCLVEKYGLGGAIRILKIAQAINDGDYSAERLEELLKLSYQGRTKLKGIEGIDYDKYVNALDATYLGTDVKVPNQLAGCDRDDTKSLKVTKRQARSGKVVKPTGSAADRVKTGENRRYGFREDGGSREEYDNSAARDNRVNEHRQKYPKSKITPENWD